MLAVGTKDTVDNDLVCATEKEEVPVKWISANHDDNCNWRPYFLDCTFASSVDQFEVKRRRTPDGEKNMAVDARALVSEKLPVTVCFNQMYMFERWQTALAVLQLYQAYGASALVIPIHSVIEELYDVLEYFEKRMDGIRIDTAPVLPNIPELGFDVSSQIEKAGWLLSANECLYVYRRAAEFIIFADYDELIIPRFSNHLYEELWALSRQYPSVASFEFRLATASANQYQSPQHFRIQEFAKTALVQQVAPFGIPAVIANRTERPFLHNPLISLDIGDNDHKLMTKDDAWAFKFHFPYFNPRLRDLAIPSYHDSRSGLISTAERIFQTKIKENKETYLRFHKLSNERIYEKKMSKCRADMRAQKFQCDNDLHCIPPPSPELPRCVVVDSRATKWADGTGRVLYTAFRRVFRRQKDCTPFMREAEDIKDLPE
ncbi:unnamed protein product [Bursaphelenchus xylophilus]|uniref:Glycosyltransferase family 92 protein n=1 Tax=Bursaphelenchus xylophilus TaxID=6326 RepID=A0A1I7S4M8_BURXY|nr:unnamed protein product [Bursaphelenchus xylophilus]CAG9117243.1 unnamed protein product [Bursaphelenchus xylophilus]